MSFMIVILALLLSTVVRVTDSCSSFTGWKLRQVDVQQHKVPKIKEEEVTTKTIDHMKDNKNASANNKTPKAITVPIIIEMGKKYERCSKNFEDVYCHHQGKCIVIDNHAENQENEKIARCICDPGYVGDRCMFKAPDFNYSTLKDPPEIVEDEEIMSIISNANSTMRSTTSRELGHRAPCPSPWKEDLCLNGECYIVPDLSSVDHFCLCHDGFIGARCHEKIASFHYKTQTNRKRRHLSDTRRRKSQLSPKFRTKS